MAEPKAAAKYFARVELHDAKWPDDYQKLHEELEKIGFKRCINLASGLKKLPTGFYFATGLSEGIKAIYSKVSKAAEATGYEHEIVVIQSADSRSGLSSDCDLTT